MDALYLSRLALALRNRDVHRDLSDCQALHRRLLLAYPNLGGIDSAREQFGILYRLESGDGGATVLVQSSSEPDWSRLPANYLIGSHTLVKRIDTLYDSITLGQRLLFRLRANPTRRISDRNTSQSERWRGKRVDIRSEEDQLRWLEEKGKHAGFALLTIRTNPTVHDARTSGVDSRLIGSHPRGRLTFASVTFEGRLQVTDRDAFLQALQHGIGSGKAFGFGMLSIAPLPA